MTTRRADVYKGDELAAVLMRNDVGCVFEYLPTYGGVDVATTLRKSNGPVQLPGAAVPPFSAGLLPEGRRLTSMRQSLKISADDELSLLAEAGGDAVGDTRVLRHGEQAITLEPRLIIDGDIVASSFSAAVGPGSPIDRGGIPGVQDKISGRMMSYPVGTESSEYILKLNPPEYPHVVENELFFMRAAASCGIAVARARVIHDQTGDSGLLVERFDRGMLQGGRIQRFAVEDACQALNVWPADKYSVSAEQACNALVAHCAAQAVAARDLFRQFVFASLTGDGDVHAKNISMIRRAGEWRIAPAYDLPSTLFYHDDTLALPVDGSTAPLSRRRALRFASDIGLPEKAAVKAIDALLAGTRGLAEKIEAGALPYDARTNREVARKLAYRRRQLIGA